MEWGGKMRYISSNGPTGDSTLLRQKRLNYQQNNGCARGRTATTPFRSSIVDDWHSLRVDYCFQDGSLSVVLTLRLFVIPAESLSRRTRALPAASCHIHDPSRVSDQLELAASGVCLLIRLAAFC